MSRARKNPGGWKTYKVVGRFHFHGRQPSLMSVHVRARSAEEARRKTKAEQGGVLKRIDSVTETGDRARRNRGTERLVAQKAERMAADAEREGKVDHQTHFLVQTADGWYYLDSVTPRAFDQAHLSRMPKRVIKSANPWLDVRNNLADYRSPEWEKVLVINVLDGKTYGPFSFDKVKQLAVAKNNPLPLAAVALWVGKKVLEHGGRALWRHVMSLSISKRAVWLEENSPWIFGLGAVPAKVMQQLGPFQDKRKASRKKAYTALARALDEPHFRQVLETGGNAIALALNNGLEEKAIAVGSEVILKLGASTWKRLKGMDVQTRAQWLEAAAPWMGGPLGVVASKGSKVLPFAKTRGEAQKKAFLALSRFLGDKEIQKAIEATAAESAKKNPRKKKKLRKIPRHGPELGTVLKRRKAGAQSSKKGKKGYKRREKHLARRNPDVVAAQWLSETALVRWKKGDIIPFVALAVASQVYQENPRGSIYGSEKLTGAYKKYTDMLGHLTVHGRGRTGAGADYKAASNLLRKAGKAAFYAANGFMLDSGARWPSYEPGEKRKKDCYQAPAPKELLQKLTPIVETYSEVLAKSSSARRGIKKFIAGDLARAQVPEDDRCQRCGGLGHIPSYKHIEGGVCFGCGGSGEEERARS